MAKNIYELTPDLRRKLQQVAKEVSRGMLIVIGKNATDMFRDNIRQGGFRSGGRKKWLDVKRRDPGSPWYGFEYRGEKRTHYRLTRDKTGKTRKAKSQARLNFSPAATRRVPLTSRRLELYNSLRYLLRPGEVSIASDTPYAQVQNEGGQIRVFGKHAVRLPARPYMGPSKELDRVIGREIQKRMDTIFKQ